MAVGVFSILIVVLIVGIAIGSLGTAIVLFLSRGQAVQHSDDPPVASDPSNPYAPSQITTRIVGARVGCGVAGVLLLLAGTALLGVLVWAGARSAAPIPATPVPPTPVATPAPAVTPPPAGTPDPSN